jgi:hypothetical protein
MSPTGETRTQLRARFATRFAILFLEGAVIARFLGRRGRSGAFV